MATLFPGTSVHQRSFQAPKGRDNLAQANGLGLQIVTRTSPERAIHETTILPHG